MNEKEKRIIEVSIKLFAQKGYHATSIQEIAKQSNVSKGAFYLYFDSKADLTKAIFNYYSQLIMEKMNRINEQDLNPKPKLVKQIRLFLDMLSEHKEYIIMQFRDNLQIGDQFEELVIQMNQQSFRWMSNNLRQIYGEIIEHYVVDASIQLEGLLQSYSKWLVMHDLDIDTGQLAAFIVRRVDNVIQGMIHEQEQPQVRLEQVNFQGFSAIKQTSDQQKIQTLMTTMLAKINELPMDVEQKQQLQEAADLIIEELEKKEPKKVIIQGMLTHFQAIPQCKRICKELAELLQVQLLT